MSNISSPQARVRVLLVVLPFFILAATTGVGYLTQAPQKAQAQEEDQQTLAQTPLLGAEFASTHLALGGPQVDLSEGILIPYPATIDEKKAEVTAVRESSSEISTYVVEEGDTLSSIAQEFGVSINTIRWSNSIRSDTGLQVGETLVILPVTGVKHTVASGDTLSTIADGYKSDIEEIKDYNGIEDVSLIAVGDELIIPDGEITPTTQKAAPRPSRPSSNGSGPSAAPSSGYFIHPAPGSLVTQGYHGHNGVDFGAPTGSTIRAAASGEVILSRHSGYNGGYGTYIVIRHPNGTQTLYSHNSANYVNVGDWVEQGTVIGTIGSTGRSTGSHLHFEVRGTTNPWTKCGVMSRCGS